MQWYGAFLVECAAAGMLALLQIVALLIARGARVSPCAAKWKGRALDVIHCTGGGHRNTVLFESGSILLVVHINIRRRQQQRQHQGSNNSHNSHHRMQKLLAAGNRRVMAQKHACYSMLLLS